MLLVYCCVHKFYTRSYIELQRIDAVSPSAFGIGFAVAWTEPSPASIFPCGRRAALPHRISYNVLRLVRVQPGMTI